VCASILAAEPGRPTKPEAMNDFRARQKAPKSKHAFHPLRLLRRLGNAESEFGLRLSSLGIPREGEAVDSEVLPRPSPLTEASKSMPQGLGGASQ
jgi:hypothetical protein